MWAGNDAIDCGELADDAPADAWQTLHDCVLSGVGAGTAFVATWGSNTGLQGMGGRTPPVPWSWWTYNGAGWVAVECASITATADCTPGGGEACLQCDAPSGAIDNVCVSM